MAEFLTTSGTSNWIEKIIIEAKEQLVLISPYLKFSKTFQERLNDTSKRGVNIVIIYGKDELKESEKQMISTLEHVNLYFFVNLHAKCYYNENNMVITSMNMYEFSEKNNREMGVLIRKTNDVDLFENAVNEAISIKNNAKVIQVRYNQRNANIRKQETKKQGHKGTNKWGFCIRCGENIPYNPNRPLCESHFLSWSYWQNYDFIENRCHCCGEEMPSSMGKPLCLDCFTRN
jgi:phosphatidylserine/phosphatidylglycerophosphate/cardiolipin synthase-like enzyme